MKRPTLDTTDSTDAAAFSAAREVCRNRAGELLLASWFLPRGKRRGAQAVGAFIVMIADAFASNARPSASGSTGEGCSSTTSDQFATVLRERIDDIYAQRLELPLPQFRSREHQVLHAAARTVNTFGIPHACFDQFIEGCCTEFTVMRYATWSSLRQQLLRTGGAVAEMLAAVVGATHSDAPAALGQLGAGLRLTMILRGLPRQLSAGRVPLPLADLVRCGCTERELLNGEASDAARRVLRHESERARSLLREGAEAIPWLAGDGPRLFAAAMCLQGMALLDQIAHRDGDVFTRRIGVPTAQKLRRLPALVRLARREADEPLRL